MVPGRCEVGLLAEEMQLTGYSDTESSKMTMPKTEKAAAEKGDFFQIIGSFGPFQMKIFAIFFVVNTVGVWQNFAVTFLAPNIDFRCVPPEYTLVGVNYSEPTSTDPQFNGTNVFKYDHTDQCHVSTWRNLSQGQEHFNETVTFPCQEWEYDKSFYEQTIVSEWDLVCDREWLVSFAKSIYMIGFMCSVLIFGQMADWAGRYPTLVVCYVISVISGLLSVFSQSYMMFIILRFFLAFGRTGLTTTGYVLLMELTGPEKRTSVGIAIQIGWSFGMVTLPALAWFVRPWMWLQLATALPFIPLACICCMIPESPRWLRTQGKVAKFERTLAKACKQNGRKSEFNIANLLSLENEEKNQKEDKTRTIVDLVKTPQMRKRTICMAYLWFVNAFVYYSLAYNTNDLGGDPYLNFLLSAALEFPSYLAVYFAIRTIGRRLSLIIGMFIGGVSCAAIMAVPPDLTWLVVTLAMIGKFFITGTFGILYLYTTEMFPTVVRNIAVGSCSTFARVGSILAPFARELGKSTHYTVPNGVNAALAITSGILAVLLPETKDRTIPDTLEEGEAFSGESIDLTNSKVYKSFCKPQDSKNGTKA